MVSGFADDLDFDEEVDDVDRDMAWLGARYWSGGL